MRIVKTVMTLLVEIMLRMGKIGVHDDDEIDYEREENGDEYEENDDEYQENDENDDEYKEKGENEDNGDEYEENDVWFCCQLGVRGRLLAGLARANQSTSKYGNHHSNHHSIII